MSDSYRVIFSGEVVQGCEVDEVKEKITSILKEDSEYIENLFSGQPITIIEDPDLTKCQKIMNIFISVGAVCYIKDPKSETDYVLEVITSSSTQPDESTDSIPVDKESLCFDDVKNKFTEKISTVATRTKQFLNISKENTSKILEDASVSIKSDFEIDGFKILIKNKYFQSILATSFVLLLLVIFSLTYQREVMPLTEKNCSQILNHIEFIEKAFTVKELNTMKSNPTDFLAYLLVEPIQKMGYEFDATIGEISENFLYDKFSEKKRQRALEFLKSPTRERDQLYKIGFISKITKNKLDNVSKIMSQ